MSQTSGVFFELQEVAAEEMQALGQTMDGPSDVLHCHRCHTCGCIAVTDDSVDQA
jgi:hypothetical protein